jgi:NADH dehydrogenase
MILLTGATGLVGSALLRRLTANGAPVRCLVRDPRRLGAERVRVQIALGELADARSFRHALRDVKTVIHLAASTRDQPRGSIEELNGIATWRLVRAAEAAGVERFVFFSALGAAHDHELRYFRAKALGERAVNRSSMAHTVFAPSFIYTPGDAWLTLLGRMSLLPVVPSPGEGANRHQPIWADDVADCVLAGLDSGASGRRYELAGPETLAYEKMVRLALRSFGHTRRIWPVPVGLARESVRALELFTGGPTFATPDEVDLLQASLLSERGTADAEALGVAPRAMAAVLGVSG